MLTSILRGSLILFATLVVPATAQGATNGKWYSALQCQKRTGIYYQSLGTVYSLNEGTSVQCPFERHESTISSAQIRVYARNPNAAVLCQVLSELAVGDTIFQDSETRSTTLTGPTVQTLSYGSINNIANGAHFAECYLPPPHNGALSHVVAFNVTES